VYETQSLYYITKVIERVCGKRSFYDLRLTIDLRPFQRLEIVVFGFSKCSLVLAGDLGRSHCGFVILGKIRLPADFLAAVEGGCKSGVEASPKIEEVRLESAAVGKLSILDRFHHFQVFLGFSGSCAEESVLGDGGVIKRRCKAFTVPSLIPVNTDFCGGGGEDGMVIASSADVELLPSFA
jgi:hypothetical protein